MKSFLSLLASGCLLAPSFAAPPPNIVIFLVDDMGVMDTSVPFLTDAAGNPVRYPLNDFYRTPNMERLAARGIRFNNFCAMSVCSPTRIALVTGQNAARHRTTNWINPDTNNAGPHGPAEWNWMGLNKGDVTLPRLLQANGYRTIHVGKGHFGSRKSEGADPRNLGFDVNIAGGANGAPGSYYGRQNFGNPVDGKAGRIPGNAVPGLEKYHGTDTFLSEALTLEANARVDDAVKDGQPFFLYFAHYAVHRPFNSDPRFAAHYENSGKSSEAQAFATLVEGMDKSLGDLLDHLDRLGVAENTLILFLGDNGSDSPLGEAHNIASAAPLRGKKGSHYEGGMRVPFIAAWARAKAGNASQNRLPIPAGAIQGQLASVDDLFPTILALTGTTAPQGHKLDGARLDTLLTGKREPSRRETFLMHFPHSPHRSDYWTSYRNGDWKVIYHYFPSQASGNSHYQLFNLIRDPSESHDLSITEPVQLRRMMERLMADLDEQGAQYPVRDDHVTPVKPQLPPLPSLATAKPNILLIVSDDQGYADAGFQGSPDIATPHLDQLAARGIRFTNGYVTHAFCSPSRAGLLTGRYQQRFGHERNVFYDPADHREGLPATETLLPERLRAAGYMTGWIGKWHLGAAPEFVPARRGFVETFGFIGGGHRFRDWKVNSAEEYFVPVERNGQPVETDGHLTTALGSEAAAFVRRHADQPWFLYLAFNAPHNPQEPTDERLARFAAIQDPLRRKYAAQISLMDDAIGETLAALHASGQDERTLVFFFSDNGGPPPAISGADNRPLRGAKGSPYEGGIRVPFLLSWPGQLAAGTVEHRPISAIDVFATSLGVAGAAMPTDRPYDSVNLMPYLTGQNPGAPHDRLFWRSGKQWAIREGDWKLVRVLGQSDELYNLAEDVGEQKDLARAQPAVAARLVAALVAWNKELIDPVFPGLELRKAAAKGHPRQSKP